MEEEIRGPLCSEIKSSVEGYSDSAPVFPIPLLYSTAVPVALWPKMSLESVLFSRYRKQKEMEIQIIVSSLCADVGYSSRI